MKLSSPARFVSALSLALVLAVSGAAYASSAQERIDAYKAKTAQVQSHDEGGHGKPAEHVEAPKAAAPKQAAAPRQTAKAKIEPLVPPAQDAAHGHDAAGIPSDEALKKLMEGNERAILGKVIAPNRSLARRGEVAGGQKPFAVVVTCSDSRVPPELLFDQGYGDIFVVRTAGNVVDDVALGSIEYAVDHLGARLIVVLGHSKCGAVKATCDGGEVPGHLPAIVGAIQPAVEAAKARPGELLPNAVKANVKLVSQRIMQSSPGFVEMMEDCELRVVGAVYDIDTGKVSLTYQPVL